MSSFRRASEALLLVFLVAAGGCASTCHDMEARRTAFLQRSAPPSPPQPTWHASLELPYAAVNPLIASHLSRIPAVHLGLGGPLSALLPPLILATRRVELRPATPGKVGFRVELEASLAGESAFSLDTNVAVTPRVNEQRELEVAIRPVDFETVEPRISPGARDRLGEIISRLIPRRARGLVPPSAIAEAAGATVSLLGKQLHRLLRITVLPRIGALTRLHLALPRYLPVQELAFGSLGERALLVLVRTRLPVSNGLVEASAHLARGEPQRFHVLLPGATLAALTNWGMAEGMLPTRFDASARAQPDGAHEVALDWQPGPRPLKVIAWRIHSRPCGEVVIGGEPELRVKGSSLELGVRDARVESVTGSRWLQAAVWLRTRFADSFTITRKLAADSSISIGGRPMKLRLVEGGVQGDLFWLGLEVTEPAPKLPRAAEGRVAAIPDLPPLRVDKCLGSP